MKRSKLTVLILTPYYLPGYKAGGPIQSLQNLVGHLSNLIHFKIITPNHDLGEEKPYPGIISDEWNSINGTDVFYISKENMMLSKIAKIIKQTEHDIRYYNSFFYPYLTFYPLLLERLRLIPHVPSVLAPRGEFAKAALRSHQTKKAFFLRFARFFRIYSRVHWQVTSEDEKAQLHAIFSVDEKKINMIPNLPPKLGIDLKKHISYKKAWELRLVYLSRIAPKKNLLGAIAALKKVEGKVTFDIYGPKEDDAYFSLCMQQEQELPPNIAVHYKGPVKHEQVLSLLQQYDFLFFPSKDENFGHIILESFMAGTPVIISDRTPWLNLDAIKAGWAIPLENSEKFTEVLNYCVKMDSTQHQEFCDGALKLAKDYLNDASLVERMYELFTKLL